MIRRLLLVGVTAGLLVVLLIQTATALIGRNTFEHYAQLDKNGRHIWVTALIACTAGEKLTVEVTITQERGNAENRVGALARGSTQTVCEDVGLTDDLSQEEIDALEPQEILIRATAQGSERFEPGPAVATGLAITRDRNQVSGVRQWQPAAGIMLCDSDGVCPEND